MSRPARHVRPRSGDDDLARILSREGALDVALAVEIAAAIADALGEVHARGVVHGELAPDQITVRAREPGGVVVRLRGLDPVTRGMRRSALFRPPAYLAPEQLGSDASVDARTDVWALGVVLHEALTGTLPFRASSVPELCAAIVAAPADRVRDRKPEVPAMVDEVVARCLRKDPAARWPSMDALAAALRGAVLRDLGAQTIVDPPRVEVEAAATIAEASAAFEPDAATLLEPAAARVEPAAATLVEPADDRIVEPAHRLPAFAPRPRAAPTRAVAIGVSMAALGVIASWWIVREHAPSRSIPGGASIPGAASMPPAAVAPPRLEDARSNPAALPSPQQSASRSGGGPAASNSTTPIARPAARPPGRSPRVASEEPASAPPAPPPPPLVSPPIPPRATGDPYGGRK